jgi:Mn-dependent DtxR family transcriptional regulator
MNTKALIDGLVRQTTVLIANVATSAGLRAPLAHVANQIFVDLTSELERQGVGQKVIADMFGLALRSYQQKLRRLSESATDKGRTLWEAIYEFLSAQQAVRRVDVLLRFSRDDESSVKSILKDLCESGLVYRTGKGDATVYRATPTEDLYAGPDANEQSTASLLWVIIHHEGPLGLEQLEQRLSVSRPTLQSALKRLVEERQVVSDGAQPPKYRSDECLIPLGAREGWEAALLDQFQAMVRSMCIKLANGQTRALPDDEIGGSTYTFDIWAGHPREPEVKALLRDTRERLSRLWDSVTEFNASQPSHPRDLQRVTFYCGQSATVDTAEDSFANSHADGHPSAGA